MKVKTSSKSAILTGAALFALLFVGGGLWAAYSDLSGAVIASGNVAVMGKPKTVQHLDGGIVAKINIKDGDKVKQGEILIRLDDILLKTNLAIYQNRLLEETSRRDRLIAERDGLEQIRWNEKLLDLLNVELDPVIRQGQLNLFEARRKTRAGQVAQLNQKIEQFKNEIDGTSALKKSKANQLVFLKTELYGKRILKEKGLIPLSQLVSLERQKEELIGQRAEHDAELARIHNAISETKMQILQIVYEFRQNVLQELREAMREINDITQQLQATYEQLKRVDIMAPVAGVVHDLSVFTIGGVIGPGDAVLQIIPQNDKFEIEANVEPQFIDELYIGQPATLRFSAFNQRTTPELSGTVANISANIMEDDQSETSYYRITIHVTDNELARLNGRPLVPGMPVEAFIKTRDRTALNYLVKPLLDQVQRSFKEE
ncbi:MAG: HlyD family type I secretion periplasmic adaptor subunit [Sneathiella sp.]